MLLGSKIKCTTYVKPNDTNLNHVVFKEQTIPIPLIDEVSYKEEDMAHKYKLLKTSYDIFMQKYYVLISYESLLLSDKMDHLSNLLKHVDIEKNYRLYAELKNRKLVCDKDGNDFYDFFMCFFKKHFKNEKTDKNKGIEIKTYKVCTSENVMEILSNSECFKTIILDNCCNKQIHYEILFKLLECVFVHEPFYSNSLILCLDKNKFSSDNIFESEMIKLSKSFGSGLNRICYTQLIDEGDLYHIKMRIASNCNLMFNPAFKDIEEVKETPVLYRMWPQSLNGSTYTIEHIKIKDTICKNIFDFNQDLENESFTCCKYTIQTLNNTFVIKIQRKIIEYREDFTTVNFRILVQNISLKNNHFKLKDFYYEKFKNSFKNPIDCNSNDNLTELYKYLNYLIHYNPNFDPTNLFTIEFTELKTN